MKIGLGLYSLQRPPFERRSYAELYGELLDEAVFAEEVGLDSVWITEHHFCEDGYVPAVFPVCAAIAARTSKIRIGTGPAITSFYHPLRLAEDVIALDIISRGRFIPCLGLGYRRIEFEGLGIDPATDFDRMDETLAILRRAFTGQEFAFDGTYYHWPRLQVTPTPFTPGGPEIMLAGDHVVDRDAEYAGNNSAPYMLDPSLSWDELLRIVAIYDAALPAGAQQELPVFAYGYVSESGSAWSKIEAGFTYVRKTYDSWQGKPAVTGRLNPSDFRLVMGTPDEVVRQIAAYREQFGDRLHLILRLNYPGMDSGEVKTAIKQLGIVASRLGANK